MTLHEVCEQQKDQENRYATSMSDNSCEYYMEILHLEEADPGDPYYVVAWRTKRNDMLTGDALGVVPMETDHWCPYVRFPVTEGEKMTLEEIWKKQQVHEDKFAITPESSAWYVKITPLGRLLDSFYFEVKNKKTHDLFSENLPPPQGWPFDVELEDKAWRPYTPTNLLEEKS